MLKSSKQIQEKNNFSKFGLLETVYNVLYRGAEKELINYCDLENIDIISYSPLGAGFITGKYKNGQVSPKKTRFDIKPSPRPVPCKAGRGCQDTLAPEPWQLKGCARPGRGTDSARARRATAGSTWPAGHGTSTSARSTATASGGGRPRRRVIWGTSAKMSSRQTAW